MLAAVCPAESFMIGALKNIAQVTKGHGLEVGLCRTSRDEESEAWLFWIEGQGITTEFFWKHCTRAQAIEHINMWLAPMGLHIVENVENKEEDTIKENIDAEEQRPARGDNPGTA
jgi:hypothetical protein